MKITLVYDNKISKKGLTSDHGFSCLIEMENIPRILFDAGASGSILLSNMERLNIDPESIEEVFISHAHRDHTGGLSDLFEINGTAKLYIPASFSEDFDEREVIVVKEFFQIHENIFSTGELKGIEQSMAIKTEKGIVLVVGCSHSGVGNIINAASKLGKVYAIIGGLHGFREFNLLENLDLVCAAHCTQFISKIRSLYPKKFIDGGVGRILAL